MVSENWQGPTSGPEDPRLATSVTPEIRRTRSIAKALSWRVVGTLDTLLLSFAILSLLGPTLGIDNASSADNARTATAIGLTELATKTTLYYLHDRLWMRIHWNRTVDENGHYEYGTRRTASKTATWRVLASLDTTLLAWFFTGNLATAISIGGFEIITKLVLYFYHERIWARIRWGIVPVNFG